MTWFGGRPTMWGIADQAVSSLSNLVVLVLVARSISPEGFGAFAVAMEAYLVAVFIGRGVSSDPLVTAHAPDDPSSLSRAARQSAAAAMWAGVACGLLSVVAGLLTDGALGSNLVVLGVLLPGLLLQDCVRYVFIVRQTTAGAFFLDALWLALEVPVLLLAAEHHTGSAAMLAGWGASGVVVAAVGLTAARLVPASPRAVRDWLVAHLRVWPYYLAENLVFRATILVVMGALTVTAGLGGVAGLRAATAIFAPVAVLGRGVVMVAVPELARQATSPERVRLGVRRLAWALTPLPLVLAVVLMLAPASVGQALFGRSWALASPLLALTAISVAGSMYAIAVGVGLRALQAARSGLSARVVVALLALVTAVLGGVAGDEFGAALALAASAPVQAAVWWYQFRQARLQAGRADHSLSQGEGSLVRGVHGEAIGTQDLPGRGAG